MDKLIQFRDTGDCTTRALLDTALIADRAQFDRVIIEWITQTGDQLLIWHPNMTAANCQNVPAAKDEKCQDLFRNKSHLAQIIYDVISILHEDTTTLGLNALEALFKTPKVTKRTSQTLTTNFQG